MQIKKIKPMFNAIVTTMEMYSEDQLNKFGLIDSDKQQGCLKEFQTIIATGDSVRAIKVGDLVKINPARYAVMKHKKGSLQDNVMTDNPVIDYNFNIVEMNGEKYLLLQDSDISYIVEDYVEDEVTTAAQSTIIQPDKRLIGI